jgi:hypothetical protein
MPGKTGLYAPRRAIGAGWLDRSILPFSAPWLLDLVDGRREAPAKNRLIPSPGMHKRSLDIR